MILGRRITWDPKSSQQLTASGNFGHFFSALCLTRFPVIMPMGQERGCVNPGVKHQRTTQPSFVIICQAGPQNVARQHGPTVSSRHRPARSGIGEVEGHGLKRDSAKEIRCRAPLSPTVTMPQFRTCEKLACMDFP